MNMCLLMNLHFFAITLMILLRPVFGSGPVNITTELYNQLVENSYWAKIAYCAANSSFDGGPLAGECPGIGFCRNATYVNLTEVVHPGSSLASGTAYVAVDTLEKEVIVGFRGSSTTGDWLTNLNYEQCDYVPYLTTPFNSGHLKEEYKKGGYGRMNGIMRKYRDDNICTGCKIHCGVYLAYAEFMDEVEDGTREQLKDGYTLTVTGHSLGGAYATLAGLDFKINGTTPLVITYASLMIGNPEFNSFMDHHFDTVGKDADIRAGKKLGPGSFARVYETADIVPQLPPSSNSTPWPIGKVARKGCVYSHGGLQFELTTDVPGKQTADHVMYHGPSDHYKVGQVSLSFSDILHLRFLPYHLNYFISQGVPCSDESWFSFEKTVFVNSLQSAITKLSLSSLEPAII